MCVREWQPGQAAGIFSKQEKALSLKVEEGMRAAWRQQGFDLSDALYHEGD